MDVSVEINDFVRDIKLHDHLILFYDTIDAKRTVLYPFLKDGLSNNNGVLYICSDETPEQVREGFKTYLAGEFDSRSESIQIKNYDEWYILDGTVDPFQILSHWEEAQRYFADRGLGLRVTGETSCFFEKGLVRDLLRYEYACHRFFNIRMDAICAYSVKTIVECGYEDVIMPLIRAHGKALFVANGGSIVFESEKVEDTDVEKLLDIKILQSLSMRARL